MDVRRLIIKHIEQRKQMAANIGSGEAGAQPPAAPPAAMGGMMPPM
jgi:hypothetical protein